MINQVIIPSVTAERIIALSKVLDEVFDSLRENPAILLDKKAYEDMVKLAAASGACKGVSTFLSSIIGKEEADA